MNCSTLSELESLAAALGHGARLELHLTPKPGLVDRDDCGSHPDLSLPLMERSIEQVRVYLDQTFASLAAGESFARQRALGVAAEQCLLETLGTNTHKGYIFLAGMLLIARSKAACADEGAVRAALGALAGEFFACADAAPTHGQRARETFRCGGIVAEAMAGFPSVFEQGLPVFRAARQHHGDFSRASFALLARLMQCVDDTTTLHRAGASGLLRVKRDGARIEAAIADGADYHALLRGLNRDYVRLNITIGGVADLLGICYALLIANGEIAADELARACGRGGKTDGDDCAQRSTVREAQSCGDPALV